MVAILPVCIYLSSFASQANSVSNKQLDYKDVYLVTQCVSDLLWQFIDKLKLPDTTKLVSEGRSCFSKLRSPVICELYVCIYYKKLSFHSAGEKWKVSGICIPLYQTPTYLYPPVHQPYTAY